MLSTVAVCAPARDAAASARRITRAALFSLYAELMLTPKPGLVCPGDNGSHPDMSAALLWRSLFSLRHYFTAIALAGDRRAPFGELQKLGIAAELRMLRATGGVNTHRGAIFNLGLLAAAAGHLIQQGQPVAPAALGHTVRTLWSSAICAMRPSAPSHGLLMASRHGAGGARAEAALGYPAVFKLGLPALRQALDSGLSERRALLHTLFVLIAHLTDINLLYRGGAHGLRFAQDAARDFLARGGAANGQWEARAQAIRDAFVARRLSPGGAADLLAATWFAHLITDPL
jgi:triphosphoribosyl-dephospho-CoA synthase